jgi:O-antigen ligase
MSSPTPFIPIRHRMSLGLLGLTMVLPFLQPIHLQPIPSFYSELAAAALSLLAASALLSSPRAWSRFPVPRSALVPAVLIVAIVVQWLAGRIVFPEVALIHALYLLWAALLACVAALLVRDLGLAPLVGTLAWAIIVGALISAVVVTSQFLKWPMPDWLVLSDSVPSTNLGQRNHAADYFWLGVVSAIGLRLRGSMSSPVVAVVLFALVFGAVLTGSRGPLAYGMILTVLSTWWWLRERTPMACKALFLSAGTAGGFLVGSGLMAIATKAGPFAATGGAWAADRLGYGALKGDARVTLWHDAWNVFLEAPWLGNGVGNYHWHSFEMASRTPPGLLALPAEHSHNLILQWLAEYGLVTTLVLVALLAAWARGAMRERLSPDRWWLLAVAAVLATHAMLEYPLWYGYFLAPAALVLGAGDAVVFRVAAPRGAVIYLVAMALAAVALTNLAQDHRRLEPSAYWAKSISKPPPQAWAEAATGLREIAGGSLLAPIANFGIALAMVPQRELATDQLTVCRRAMAFRPRPDLIAKCAVLESWTGNRPEAERLLREAEAAYPDGREEIDEVTNRWRP